MPDLQGFKVTATALLSTVMADGELIDDDNDSTEFSVMNKTTPQMMAASLALACIPCCRTQWHGGAHAVLPARCLSCVCCLCCMCVHTQDLIAARAKGATRLKPLLLDQVGCQAVHQQCVRVLKGVCQLGQALERGCCYKGSTHKRRCHVRRQLLLDCLMKYRCRMLQMVGVPGCGHTCSCGCHCCCRAFALASATGWLMRCCGKRGCTQSSWWAKWPTHTWQHCTRRSQRWCRLLSQSTQTPQSFQTTGCST